MSKKVIRLITLILAVAMIASLAVGCGDNADKPSDGSKPSGGNELSGIADGVDVRGYFYWSFMDNYEWGSFRPKFGLVEVDFETFERKPKPSAYFYQEIIKNNGGFPASKNALDKLNPSPIFEIKVKV